MQQQPALPMNPSQTNISTEQIQKMLDENKQLILSILENQNLGKLAECAEYQARLQKNLLYLAAIADAQPQAPAARPQMMPHAAMQPGAHFMPQPAFFTPRPPVQFTPQHPLQQAQQPPQLQPQMLPFQGHVGVRPGSINGMAIGMHPELPHGTSTDLTPAASNQGRGGKQDSGAASESGVASTHRSAGTERGSENPESMTRKADDSKAAS